MMSTRESTTLRGALRWLPQTLFGRLLLVLAGGLVLAQLLSAGLSLAEREDLLQIAGGHQQAQRIADVVSLLDSLGPQERDRVLSVLSVPPLVVTLHDAPDAGAADAEARSGGPHAMMVEAMLRASLGSDRSILLQTDAAPSGPVEVVLAHGQYRCAGGADVAQRLAGNEGEEVIEPRCVVQDRLRPLVGRRPGAVVGPDRRQVRPGGRRGRNGRDHHRRNHRPSVPT